MPAPSSNSIDKQRGLSALFARLFWMLLGNFALLICAAKIFMDRNVSIRASDIVFWCVVLVMIVVRFLDIKYLEGQTATGAPATIKHWQKYAFILLIAAVVIWSAAHAVAFLSKS